MNLGTLITEAQRLAGRVDQDWNTRTRRWINEAQRQWSVAVPWPSLVREEDFPAAGTRQLILPQRVLHVQWIGDKTNKYPLDASNFFDREFPAGLFGGTTGAARFWREVGSEAVLRQPAAAGILTFRTTASDVFNVCVEGLVEDTTQSGTPEQYRVVREQISLAGSQTYSGATNFVRIETLGKDDFTPADVEVRDSSSNVLARIPAFDYRSEYRRVEFLHIPAAGTIFTVRYLVAPPPMVENYQVPHTSVDPEYLVWHAAAMIHEAQSQAELAQTKFARAQQLLERRIYKERMHGDQDLRALPEPGYWNDEDQYLIPSGNQ